MTALNLLAWAGYSDILLATGFAEQIIPVQDAQLAELKLSQIKGKKKHLGRIMEFDNPNELPRKIDAAKQYLKGEGDSLDLVVVDRELLPDVASSFKDLRDLDLDLHPCDILGSAIPLLGSSDYYSHGDRFSLVPIRFGLNGVVCDRAALPILEALDVVSWSSECVKVLNLSQLLARFAEITKQAAIAKWDFAFNQLVLHAHKRGSISSHDQQQLKALDIEELASWDAMHQWFAKKRTFPAIVLGPADMLVGALASGAGGAERLWLPVRGAGLLWVEGLAVINGLKKEKYEICKGFLGEFTEMLRNDSAKLAGGTRGKNYIALPVLGWQVNQEDAIRDLLSQLGYGDKLEGLKRGQPCHRALNQFLTANALNSVGIVLRGHPAPELYSRG